MICTDCGHGYATYMATAEVWRKAGLSWIDNVCIACLGNRLGRAPTPEDFTAAPCNRLIHTKGMEAELGLSREAAEYARRKLERQTTNI